MEGLPKLMSMRSTLISKLSFIYIALNHLTYLAKENHLTWDNLEFSTLQYLVEAYAVRVAKLEKTKLLKPFLVDPEQKMQTRLYSREWGATWWNQFSILFKRGLKERRHEYFSCMRVTQVLSTAIIMGLLWWRSDASSPKGLQDQATISYMLMLVLVTQFSVKIFSYIL